MLTARDGRLTTLFAHPAALDIDWTELFGQELLGAARGAAVPLSTAFAAGRWGTEAAYGTVAAIEDQATSLLCLLRHHRPFDAIEIAGAQAAGVLLAQALDDGRRLAVADRIISVRDVERAVRHGLELTGRDAGVLAKTIAAIAASIDASGASIMVVDGEELVLRGAVGLPDGAVGQRRPIGEGIAGWVARNDMPVELRGPVSDARFAGTDPGASDALVLPLRTAGRVVGVLSVKRSGPAAPFDELERTLAEELADALARAARVPAPSSTTAGTAVAAEARSAAISAVARLRILAVEDHPVMRLGIRALLEREGMTVNALSATCAEAVELARAGGLDVALVDLNLPDAGGVAVVERLHAAAPALPIIAFTIDTTADRVRAAIRAGAVGYLSKSSPTGLLVAAVRAAAAGLSALAPPETAALLVARDVLDRSRAAETGPPPRTADVVSAATAEPAPPTGTTGRTAAAGPPALPDRPGAPGPRSAVPDRGGTPRSRDPLTTRELEFLRYLAEGYTNKEIARAMLLAEDTVKKGVQTLIAKLGATDRTHAVVLALRSALIA